MNIASSYAQQRLLKDISTIMKSPLTEHGIHYTHDEQNMLQGYAMIIGPPDTPYFGGFYLFQFVFPFDYPFSPPQVTYFTNDGHTRFNPNLYTNGKVCLSILNTWVGEKWSACQTISTILLTLCSILNNTPFANEPGYSKDSEGFIPYQKTIHFKNIDFAICKFLQDPTSIPSSFLCFYSSMKESFLNNYDNILEEVEERQSDNSVEFVKIYGMTTAINYSILKQKLVDTRKLIDTQKELK